MIRIARLSSSVIVLIAFFWMTCPHAGAATTFTALHDFCSTPNGFCSDGYDSTATLVFDSQGNLYGTTASGGPAIPNCIPCGTIFKASQVNGVWSYQVLYGFTGGADGGMPHGSVVFDSAGNMYGTAYEGGIVNSACELGCGTVFEFSASGVFTVLHSFSSTLNGDGASPWSGLAIDAAGNLYGTTGRGGAAEEGVVFELSPSASGWTYSILHQFVNRNQGYEPVGLIIDSAGNLYGTAQIGGSENSSCSGNNGCGTVFELSPSGSGWLFKVLYVFQGTNGNDGAVPWGTMILDKAGNLLGTTYEGGSVPGIAEGVVFELSHSGGKWKEQVIHSFSGTDGQLPVAGLAADKAGNYYGTTSFGGSVDSGTVFELTPPRNGGSWKFISLYNFTFGALDGAQPYGGVVSDASGNLYGTSSTGPGVFLNDGTLFKLSVQ